MTTVDYRGMLSGALPFKPLMTSCRRAVGRNNQGRITTRHKGGGEKKRYRMIDFRQDKFEVRGSVETVEYDPFRTAFIARVIYQDGERRYILASKNMKTGDEVLVSDHAPLQEGNRLPLKNIPVGYFVCNVELVPGKGGVLIRSAGSSAQVLGQEGKYTHLKMPSGEVRKVLGSCWASLGQLSNAAHNLVVIGKAGRSRWLGIRPTVRGSAMNPRDHPYGGGEGRALRGTKRPKTLWGKVTGGRRTRNKKKWSNTLIVKRRS
nr:ribosomal protein L2 [uncultured bacterium]